MKWKKYMGILLAGICFLTGCSSGTAQDQEIEESVATKQQVSEEENVPDEEPSGEEFSYEEFMAEVYGDEYMETEEDTASEENTFPRLDGSLANEPLLKGILVDVAGYDEDTAEIYLADCFYKGGTSTSWGSLIYGGNDLIISYEPPMEVKEEYKTEFEELEIDPLGRDGLVFIVNVQNPVDSLTVDQIRDIYTGRITDWSQVGGNYGKIQAFQRNETSGSQTLLNKLVMNGEEPMEPERELLESSMGGLIEAVAGFDGSGDAIGFSVYYYAEMMKADPNLKMIKVEGIEPSNKTIEDGTYPLVNDFYVAIRASEKKESETRKLRDWLLSEEGKKLLEKEKYVWGRTGLEESSHGAGNIFK